MPSPAHLVDSHTSEPIVYASVQQVPEAARGQVSLDTLRDLLLPVTRRPREGAAPGSSTFTDFNLVEETVPRNQGFEGSRGLPIQGPEGAAANIRQDGVCEQRRQQGVRHAPALFE